MHCWQIYIMKENKGGIGHWATISSKYSWLKMWRGEKFLQYLLELRLLTIHLCTRIVKWPCSDMKKWFPQTKWWSRWDWFGPEPEVNISTDKNQSQSSIWILERNSNSTPPIRFFEHINRGGWSIGSKIEITINRCHHCLSGLLYLLGWVRSKTIEWLAFIQQKSHRKWIWNHHRLF